MKKTLFILLLLSVALSFSYTYNFNAAVVSSLGSVLGAYIGQNLSVPILIFLNKISLINEDIYSPFSTTMFDAMDTGALVGSVVGGVAAKYIYTKNINLGYILLDTAISLSVYSIVKNISENFTDDQFLKDVVISPISSGIVLGGVW